MILTPRQIHALRCAVIQSVIGLAKPESCDTWLVAGPTARVHRSSARALARMGLLAAVEGSPDRYEITDAGIRAISSEMAEEVARVRRAALRLADGHPEKREALSGCDAAARRLAAALEQP